MKYKHIELRSVITELLSNHCCFFTGINSQLKNKFMRFSCPNSLSGDMILTVKHNVDTLCLVAINNNLSSQYHCGILHRWLLLCYKTRDLQEIKTEKKINENAGEERNKLCDRMKSTGLSSECDHNLHSPWSIVGWHAALTFTYIICHHFTINHRFTTLVNARALKILSPSSLCHHVLLSLSLSLVSGGFTPSPPSSSLHLPHPFSPAGLVFNSGEGQSR